jgi:hypothetical protein
VDISTRSPDWSTSTDYKYHEALLAKNQCPPQKDTKPPWVDTEKERIRALLKKH